MAAMEKLTEDMTKAGVLLDTGGIQERQSGVGLRLEKSRISVTDGPYTDANEVIGGFAIIQVKSKESAVEFAKQFLDIHSQIMGADYTMELEMRRLYGPDEFAPPDETVPH
jgi:hypothetical protein